MGIFLNKIIKPLFRSKKGNWISRINELFENQLKVANDYNNEDERKSDLITFASTLDGVVDIIENYKRDLETELSKDKLLESKPIPVPEEEQKVESVPMPATPPFAPGTPPNFESPQVESVPMPATPPFAPGTPPFAPGTPPQLEQSGGNGNANVFEDPRMNASFNLLDNTLQAQILQRPPGEREQIMNEIMIRSTNKTDEINNNNNILNNAFNNLPQDKQLVALQGGYKSMADEFKKIGTKIEDPLITIKKPIDISEQIKTQFPLLKVDTDTDNNNADTDKETEHKPSEKSIETTDIITVKKL